MRKLVDGTCRVLALLSIISLGIGAVPGETQAPKTGTIVLYRGSAALGFGVACPIRFRGREIVELGRGKFSKWIVPAGSYVLTNKTSSVEVNVSPGAVQYVRCLIKPGFMSGQADLQIVDQETFEEHAGEFEEKNTLFSP